MNYQIAGSLIWKTVAAADGEDVFGDFQEAKHAAIAMLKREIADLRMAVKAIRHLKERDLVTPQEGPPSLREIREIPEIPI